MVAGRQVGHLRALDPGVGARLRPGGRGDRRPAGPAGPAGHGLVALQRVVRELAAVPREPRRPPPRRGVRHAGLPRLRRRLGGGPGPVGPRRVGGALRRHRRPLRRAGDQAPRRLLPVAHRGAQPAPARLPLGARRGGRVGRGRPGPGVALRRVLLRGAGLDVQRPSHRRVQRPAGGPAAGRLRGLRRGPRARADRPLPAQRAVERHLVAGQRRPGWPACCSSTTRRCPTAW